MARYSQFEWLQWRPAGKKMLKVVPTPRWLSITIKPLCPLIVAWVLARPKPKPCLGAFVVKNGSATWASASGSIPTPVSVKTRLTYAPCLGFGSKVLKVLVEKAIIYLDSELTAIGHGLTGILNNVFKRIAQLGQFSTALPKVFRYVQLKVDIVGDQIFANAMNATLDLSRADDVTPPAFTAFEGE